MAGCGSPGDGGRQERKKQRMNLERVLTFQGQNTEKKQIEGHSRSVAQSCQHDGNMLGKVPASLH